MITPPKSPVTRHITKRPVKTEKKVKAAAAGTSNAFRKQAVILKTARGRKNSSQRWLQRQLNDPYVQEAQALGYRSRATFKFIEINDRFDLIKPNSIVVDLGAAPGGWSQIVAHLMKEKRGKGHVFALDMLEMDALAGVTFIQGDFLEKENKDRLAALLPGPVDLIISDMAAYTTGHAGTDHVRTKILGETALSFALEHLKIDGNFVAKVFAGGTHKEMLDLLKRYFKTVKHFKPPASRKESPETYVVCLQFKGNLEDPSL
jgi:23S rRNA (uridine2552-2'-O)-methyltransferase